MPHITLTVYSGKKKEALDGMAAAVRESLADGPWGLKPTDISVSVAEFAAGDWEREVQKKLETETLYISSDYVK